MCVCKSHEAVRFCYGEVAVEDFSPSPQVNEELLGIASALSLPALAELCAGRLAAEATTANVVDAVRLCEEHRLSELRTALVKGSVEDATALDAVAKDPLTPRDKRSVEGERYDLTILKLT